MAMLFDVEGMDRGRKAWTSREDSLLREFRQKKLTLSQMCERMPWRSLDAIRMRFTKMHGAASLSLTETEIEALTEMNAAGKRDAEIARRLHVSLQIITKARENLGLPSNSREAASSERVDLEAKSEIIRERKAADELPAINERFLQALKDAGHAYGCGEMNIPGEGLAPRIIPMPDQSRSYTGSHAAMCAGVAG
jgi:DNA-binding CsgD family transcriptional regulator